MTGTTRYRIVLRDELSDRFEAMFEPMEMNRSEGTTVLVGDVVDQAQLHGLLERVARLGIELISVEAEGSRLERTMTREGQMEIGPVDYMIVAFPGSKFRGEIAPALGKLVESGTIRIIDVAFVSKSESGDILAAELTELDPDVQEGLEKLGIEVEGLFNDEDLEAAGEELEPGSSAALLVWENVWAREAAQAIRDAGGVLLDFERLPHEVVQAARDWALANR